MDNFNIMFTNVGRRVVVINSFRASLQKLGLQGKIIGVDANRLSPAFYITDKSFEMCLISEDSYIPNLLEICQQESIKLLLSFLDTDLIKLADSREEFAKQGTFVMISSPEMVRISRDKKLTNKFFIESDVLTPTLWDLNDAMKYRPFPLIIKPIDGSASTKVFKIMNSKELEFFSEFVPKFILMDYIYGDEFTVDIFIDLNKNVRAIVPRKRLEVREGEVSKSKIILEPNIMKTCRKVGEAIANKGGLGMINVQCIADQKGNIHFIEINPRFGGGCPLSLKAGYPFPEWIIQMVLNRELSPIPENLGEGLIMLRYDEAIFI